MCLRQLYALDDLRLQRGRRKGNGVPYIVSCDQRVEQPHGRLAPFWEAVTYVAAWQWTDEIAPLPTTEAVYFGFAVSSGLIFGSIKDVSKGWT